MELGVALLRGRRLQERTGVAEANLRLRRGKVSRGAGEVNDRLLKDRQSAGDLVGDFVQLDQGSGIGERLQKLPHECDVLVRERERPDQAGVQGRHELRLGNRVEADQRGDPGIELRGIIVSMSRHRIAVVPDGIIQQGVGTVMHPRARKVDISERRSPEGESIGVTAGNFGSTDVERSQVSNPRAQLGHPDIVE